MELTGRERIWLQHCHNVWQWIREGHGASSFLETSKGKFFVEEIQKFLNRRSLFPQCPSEVYPA